MEDERRPMSPLGGMLAEQARTMQTINSAAYQDGNATGENARKLRRLIAAVEDALDPDVTLRWGQAESKLRAAIEEARR